MGLRWLINICSCTRSSIARRNKVRNHCSEAWSSRHDITSWCRRRRSPFICAKQQSWGLGEFYIRRCWSGQPDVSREWSLQIRWEYSLTDRRYLQSYWQSVGGKLLSLSLGCQACVLIMRKIHPYLEAAWSLVSVLHKVNATSTTVTSSANLLWCRASQTHLKPTGRCWS